MTTVLFIYKKIAKKESCYQPSEKSIMIRNLIPDNCQ